MKSDLNKIHQSKKELKEERTKTIIISAAEKLFSQKGFEQTSMDEIAQEALFSKTTIYKYFPRKEDLYLMIGIKAYEKLNELFSSTEKKGENGFDQIYKMGWEYYTFATQYPTYRKALDLTGHYILEFQDGPFKTKIKLKDEIKENFNKQISQDLFEILNKIQERFVSIWISAVEKGQKDNSIRKDIPAAHIALTLGSMSTGFMDEISQRENTLKLIGLTPKDMYGLLLEFLKNGIKENEKK